MKIADETRAHAERYDKSGHRFSAAPFYLRACKYYQMAERFRTPIAPFVALFGAHGVVRLGQWAMARDWGRLAGWSGAAAALLVLQPWAVFVSRFGVGSSLCSLQMLVPLACLVLARFPLRDGEDGEPRAGLVRDVGGRRDVAHRPRGIGWRLEPDEFGRARLHGRGDRVRPVAVDELDLEAPAGRKRIEPVAQ